MSATSLKMIFGKLTPVVLGDSGFGLVSRSSIADVRLLLPFEIEELSSKISADFFSAKNSIYKIRKLANPTEADLKSDEHAVNMQEILRNDVIPLKRVWGNTNLFSYS